MRTFVIGTVLLAAVVVAWAQSQGSIAARGDAAFKRNGCYGCHTIGTFGTAIGPDLSHVGQKYPADYMARWLRDPALQRPTAHMPALELSEEDVGALAVYLSTLR
jgi:mono/diheme cytochrome c family protein